MLNSMKLLILGLCSRACSTLDLHRNQRRHVAKPAQPKHAVWVHAYARSGSSTILSMFAEAWPGARKGNGSVFALFEPCHKDDLLEPRLRKMGCGALLSELSDCDFTGVVDLHGWSKSHSRTRGLSDFEPQAAHMNCVSADLLAFKTISHPFDTFRLQDEAFPVLRRNRNLKFIYIIRDPRSIYTSMLTTPPFNENYNRSVAILKRICDSFALSTQTRHPRVHRIVFEHLISNPEAVMRAAYEFVGADFGEPQMAWITNTFRKGCDEGDYWEFHGSYSDCKSDPRASLDKWREFLTSDELNVFKTHDSCVSVAEAWKYS